MPGSTISPLRTPAPHEVRPTDVRNGQAASVRPQDAPSAGQGGHSLYRRTFGPLAKEIKRIFARGKTNSGAEQSADPRRNKLTKKTTPPQAVPGPSLRVAARTQNHGLNVLPFHVDLLDKNDRQSFELNLAILNSLLSGKSSPMTAENTHTLLEAAHSLGALNRKCEVALHVLARYPEVDPVQIRNRRHSLDSFQRALEHAVRVAIGGQPATPPAAKSAPADDTASRYTASSHVEEWLDALPISGLGPLSGAPLSSQQRMASPPSVASDAKTYQDAWEETFSVSAMSDEDQDETGPKAA